MLYTYAFLPIPSHQQIQRLGAIQGFQTVIQLIRPAQSGVVAAVEPLGHPNVVLDCSDEMLLKFALRHDQVICHLFSALSVLPLDFGTCFRSADTLGIHLKHNHLGYLNMLSMLQNRAEYRLTVVKGLDLKQLNQRVSHYLPCQDSSSQGGLEELISYWPPIWPSYQGIPQGRESFRSYFLLSPGQYQEALDLSERWMQHHPAWHLNWTTALPPYHFV